MSNDQNYDASGNAKHYSDKRINVIRMIEQIWGTEVTMKFCEINDFKYRMRVGKKDDPSLELTKANWYAKMAEFLRLKLKDGVEEIGLEAFENEAAGMFTGFEDFLKGSEDDNK